VENGVFKAAVTKGGEKIYAKACILTTGTYLDSEIMRGTEVVKSGPDGCVGAYGLAACLKNLGIKMFRLKTGTPPRLKKDTIDFSGLEKDEGSKYPLAFSYDTKDYIPFEEQLPCYITYTNKNTHEIIYKHLKESSMYNGIVVGTGPRYCPSIETKLVRFSSKERHQLFLEPESRYTDSIYLQGFSNSMPEEVQVEMVHSIKGLEHAKILKYAYAIEYEAIEPLQFDKTLMLRKIKGLFGAGQIIGTSGYEEAAALGLMAGINARNYIENKPGFILERDEAYIGIMIDDLVTKGTKEPYRLLSSRSEYRLLTRSDNADMRLMEKGYEVGLNSEERYQKFLERKRELERGIEVSKHIYVGNNKQVSSYCAELGFEKVDPNTSYFDLIKRQGVNYYKLSQLEDRLVKLDSELSYKLEIEVKYEGYIRLQLKEVERMHQYEGALLPSNIDYHHIDGLSLEAREALDKIRPGNIGEAMRITSVHPSDINVLLLYIRNYSKKNGL
ncbi:MAG: tRNA uridine-5-carboxymethylaminomethyl(34) synthesis enzyme MnmG, partial [Firmicutes bacterium]|nr:tRNA uridine-5-carboxymethylaminomethyl(34) synthesis enzyme MnmG [Candidatus Scatoplasma merdavium]